MSTRQIGMNMILTAALALLPTATALAATTRADTEKLIASTLSGKTLTCTSDSDRVTLSADDSGDLHVVAKYAGNISGTLDTDHEGDGAECGGVFASLNTQYDDYVIDDRYDDCERGNWGYRVMIPVKQLQAMASQELGRFEANAYAMVDAEKNDKQTRKLVCSY